MARREAGVICFDRARPEVRRVQDGGACARVRDCETLIDGGRPLIDADDRFRSAAPSGDYAILGAEQEHCAAKADAAKAIEDLSSGRRRCPSGSRRNRYSQAILRDGEWGRGGNRIEGGKAGAIVGNPERQCGTRGDAPRVDKIRVGELGQSGDVRDQIRLVDPQLSDRRNNARGNHEDCAARRQKFADMHGVLPGDHDRPEPA
jgi:hypothetical protein